MNTVIMWIMAIGVILGGVDCILGNKFGLGKRFEDGFMLLGPMALSMVGILCLVPLLTQLLESSVVPMFHAVGLDPATLGGILAIDMGGYPLSLELAADPVVGLYSGVVLSSIFGCTLVFTIPVGMGMLSKEQHHSFARGTLYGLITMPVGLLTGALLCGMSPLQALLQNLPILLLSGILLLGIWKAPAFSVRCFTVFASVIRILTYAGLTLGAFQTLTGVAIVPGLAPTSEGLKIVSDVGIVLLGSLPVTEILQRLLKKPMLWIGKKAGMEADGVIGMLISAVTITPVLANLKNQTPRDIVINTAFFVCAASALGGHLAYVLGVAPDTVGMMVPAKLVGGIVGAALAVWATRKDAPAAA